MSSPKARFRISTRPSSAGALYPTATLKSATPATRCLLWPVTVRSPRSMARTCRVGMFANEEYSVTRLSLAQGEFLVIYSDGVSEATDSFNTEYGAERLCNLIRNHRNKRPTDLLTAFRDDLAAFLLNCRKADDATLFVLARTDDGSASVLN